jgi:hypothetical protein
MNKITDMELATKTMERMAIVTGEWSCEITKIDSITVEDEISKNRIIHAANTNEDLMGDARDLGVLASMIVDKDRDMACDMLDVVRETFEVCKRMAVALDAAITRILANKGTITINDAETTDTTPTPTDTPAGWSFV